MWGGERGGGSLSNCLLERPPFIPFRATQPRASFAELFRFFAEYSLLFPRRDASLRSSSFQYGAVWFY